MRRCIYQTSCLHQGYHASHMHMRLIHNLPYQSSTCESHYRLHHASRPCRHILTCLPHPFPSLCTRPLPRRLITCPRHASAPSHSASSRTEESDVPPAQAFRLPSCTSGRLCDCISWRYCVSATDISALHFALCGGLAAHTGHRFRRQLVKQVE